MSVEHLRALLGVHADFPIPGINFLDFLPILRNPQAFEELLTSFTSHLFTSVIPTTPNKKIDVVIGLDARGFLIGPTLALRLGAAFVPVRKPGKLPGKMLSCTYEKEYGKDTFEMQDGAVLPGQTVIIVDDLIATGGSAYAAGELVKQSSGTVAAFLFIIEIEFLKGKDKLDAPTFSIIKD